MKLSPWFDAVSQPPVRKGEYELHCAVTGTTFMIVWDGKRFTHPDESLSLILPGDQWRGVLKEK